jgi:hypothetical protein
MSKTVLGKAALAVSVFACTTMLSVGWTQQKGVSLSIERAQAQMADPFASGVDRRQARQARRTAAGATAAGAAAVGAGVVAAGATAAYYGSGGPYAGTGPYAGRDAYAYYGGPGGFGGPGVYGGPGGYGGVAYYSGPGVWSPGYAAQNGIICQPGTMVRLDDGLMHNCQ